MSETTIPQTLADEMFKAGVHFGYSKTRRHPSVIKFIFATKNKVDIVNVEKVAAQLETATKLLAELAAKGKTVLFVGVKPEAREIIKEVAGSLGQPYVTERWVGGMLTNFPEIKRRIDRLADLKEKKENGELDKYTKKERLLLDMEIAKMHSMFYGISTLKKAPDAMFIIDPKREHIALAEANKIGIPVIALASTDSNIKDVMYPIVANDSSLSSIRFFMDRVQKAFRDGGNALSA